MAQLTKMPCIKPGSGESFRDCRQCPEMVIVPSGSFMMGSPAREPARLSNEDPQHLVTIGKPFAAGRFLLRVDYGALR
jgi:formylglycine-generating enzyme required for sulfatase activity